MDHTLKPIVSGPDTPSHKEEMSKLFRSLRKEQEPKQVKTQWDITHRLKRKLDEYINDMERITGRKILKEQQAMIKFHISKNDILYLGQENVESHRNEFSLNKRNLIMQWQKQTKQTWPRYQESVFVNGKIVRKAGQPYDAHHIIECSYGGPNVWWNIHPAAFPKEHQHGIHRPDGLAELIFDGGKR